MSHLPPPVKSQESSFKTVFVICQTIGTIGVLGLSAFILANFQNSNSKNYETTQTAQESVQSSQLAQMQAIQQSLNALKPSLEKMSQDQTALAQRYDQIKETQNEFMYMNEKLDKISSIVNSLSVSHSPNHEEVPTDLAITMPDAIPILVGTDKKEGSSKIDPPHPLAAKYNSMPRNLWPDIDDQPVKREARDKWVHQNIVGGMGPWLFTGTVRSVSAGAKFQPNYVKLIGQSASKNSGAYHSEREFNEQNKITVNLDLGGMNIWGKICHVFADVIIENVKPDEALSWKTGMSVKVMAKVDFAQYGGTQLILQLVGMKQ